MEDEACPIRQQQIRLNLTILDVVKKEVTKLLAARIIYSISDSNWVSPIQVVSKKSRMIVTRKDHFPFLCIDQALEKLVGKSHYCFLNGFSGYMQIHIAPEDQHKTIFTCPFGTFVYTHLSFGLCNAPNYISVDCMEFFMDNFTVYAESFDACLENLSRILTRCINTNLIDLITSLPNLTSVREICSFLVHVGFYRRYIKNFNKIVLPLSKLLQKDVDFIFYQPYIKAFQELKIRLTFALILQAPNWEYLFELMCDASNSTLEAILG
ncbi:Retrovirus-related Pol polyprotein from transposon 17.6, partial [Mucuna pruriens]